MVLWALQLMGSRYKPLREHMKLKLPSNTKELLKEPNETLDKIMTMMTPWENPTMSFHDTKEMKDQTEETKQIALKIMCEMLGLPLRHVRADDTCPYCEKPHHTREQCWARKFDGDLKDEVKTLIPSLKKIYKAQEEILHQGGFRSHQEKTMRSILHTLQGQGEGNKFPVYSRSRRPRI